MIEAALADVRRAGHEVVGAVMAGGREKLPPGGLELAGIRMIAAASPEAGLAAALDDVTPDAVLDLSDEPVLDYRRRHRMAAIALERGVRYEGADFSFTSPPRPRLATKPTLAIVGTGKRTGKTAVSGFAARTLAAGGIAPVVVAMGRGGPAEPEVVRGDAIALTPSDLLGIADSGKHAASDYIEDALLARVPTVGCRRCGGGLAGAVEFSNVGRGVEVANELPGQILLLEGSGSALPPVHADATVLVVPASIPLGYIEGYFGPYRLLLADLVLVTMCEEPQGSPSRISSLSSCIRETLVSLRGGRGGRDEVEVVRTVFRPSPTRSVEGTKVCVATTAPESAGGSIRSHLEMEFGCRVVGMTHSLSDRGRLESDLDTIMKGAEILLCEIKAAAIDVATRRALGAGLDVVYMDNVPVGVGADRPEGALRRSANLALARFESSA
ncbi:MAG: 2,3-diphosphoglycerate synthetase [Actinomycetota bacterium]